MKNTTKAQRDVELTNQTQREIVKKQKVGETRFKVGQLEAVSLTNTRGSHNSSNTQVYYKLYVCILDVLYKALKYRFIFYKHCSLQQDKGIYRMSVLVNIYIYIYMYMFMCMVCVCVCRFIFKRTSAAGVNRQQS